jgi:Major Facilitator Superfamily
MSNPIADEIAEQVEIVDLVNENDLLLKDDVQIDESPVSAEDDEDTNEGDLKAEFYRRPFRKRPNPWLLSWTFFVLMCSVTLLMAAQIDRTIELVCEDELGLIPQDDRDLRCRQPSIMAKVASVSLYREVLKGVFSFAILPRLVSLSDRIGRRPLIIYCASITLVSHLLESLCLISTPVLSYRTLYFTSVLEGVGAGATGAAIMAFPYISDCVKDSKRARHFTLMQGIQFLAIAIAPNVGSQIFKNRGNMNLLMGMSVGGDLMAAVLFLTLLKESRTLADRRMSADANAETNTNVGRTFWLTVLDTINVFKPLKVLTFPHIQDKSARRIAIFLVITKLIVVSVTMFSASPLSLLIEMIFQWRASELGVVLTLVASAASIALTVVVPVCLHLFGKLYKVSTTEIDKVDIRILQIGCLAVFLGPLLMALAGNAAVFLLGACTLQMWAITSPVIQSVIVKYSEKKHIGLVFGAMNQIVQVSTVVGQTMGLAIFQKFIQTDPRINLHISTVVMGLFLIIVFLVLR